MTPAQRAQRYFTAFISSIYGILAGILEKSPEISPNQGNYSSPLGKEKKKPIKE